MIKMDSIALAETCSEFSRKLFEGGITGATVSISLPSEEFKKLNDDFFYRVGHGEDDENNRNEYEEIVVTLDNGMKLVVDVSDEV